MDTNQQVLTSRSVKYKTYYVNRISRSILNIPETGDPIKFTKFYGMNVANVKYIKWSRNKSKDVDVMIEFEDDISYEKLLKNCRNFEKYLMMQAMPQVILEMIDEYIDVNPLNIHQAWQTIDQSLENDFKKRGVKKLRQLERVVAKHFVGHSINQRKCCICDRKHTGQGGMWIGNIYHQNYILFICSNSSILGTSGTCVQQFEEICLKSGGLKLQNDNYEDAEPCWKL